MREVSSIDVPACRVGVLADDLGSWPKDVTLEGFDYGALNPTSKVTAGERIAWLRRAPSFAPQPYDHLVRIYRDQGEDAAARKVAIARESDRRRSRRLADPARWWSRFLAVTVRYGYWPWLAAAWLLGFWLIGAALFAFGPASHSVMASTGARVPAYHPWIYPLDLLLPIVNLGQRDAWFPVWGHPWGWLYQSYAWSAIVAGWALTTALVAGIAGVVRERQLPGGGSIVRLT